MGRLISSTILNLEHGFRYEIPVTENILAENLGVQIVSSDKMIGNNIYIQITDPIRGSYFQHPNLALHQKRTNFESTGPKGDFIMSWIPEKIVIKPIEGQSLGTIAVHLYQV